MNNYKNAIDKSMLFNERVRSWNIDDYDMSDVIITVYTYKGNKLVLHLSYFGYSNAKELVSAIERLIERCDN